MYSGGYGRPGHNWDGHLPSDKMEMAILNAIEGQEDDDGNKSSAFLAGDDQPDVIHYRTHHANTGAKGVINDAKSHAMMMALQREADKVRQRELMRRQANATVKPIGDEEEEDDEEFDEDEDEDEEFKQYKLQRLREMQAKASAAASMPRFGALARCDPDEYLAVVDHPGQPHTFVIVHLHEEHIAPCVRLTYKLEELARKYDQVCFINVLASETAKGDLDESELPALIVYQDGAFKGSEKRVGREAGETLTARAVEETLMRLGVRLTSASAMKEADVAALQKLKELGVSSAGAYGRAGLSGGGRQDDDEDDDDDDEQD